jgi:hypothetical protein
MRLTRTRSHLIVFVYFVLAVLFGFFAILVGGIPVSPWLHLAGIYSLQFDFRWFVWLLAGLSVLCLLPLIDTILYRLSLSSKLPSFLTTFYSDSSDSSAILNAARLRSAARSLRGRLVIAGLSILAVLFVLSGTIAIREREIDSALFTYLTRLSGRERMPQRNANALTVKLNFVTEEQDQRRRLQSCLDIVRDLKLAGAKAVLVDYRGSLDWSNSFDMMQEIEGTGIVVFGLREWQFIGFADSMGQVPLSRGTFTIQPYEVRIDPFLFRLKPEGFYTIIGIPTLDVSMELMKKYYGYPRDLDIRRNKDKLILGDHEIPIGYDGWTYVRTSLPLWFDGSVQVSIDSNSRKRVWDQKGWGDRGWSTQNVLETRDRFRDKIVMLRGVASHAEFMDEFLFDSYRSALQAFIAGNVVSRSRTLHIWITLFCILVAGLIAFKMSPLSSVIVTFSLGLLVLIGCWILYERFNVLVEIFYPLFAIVMSMFIFPSIAAIEKMGEGKRPVG